MTFTYAAMWRVLSVYSFSTKSTMISTDTVAPHLSRLVDVATALIRDVGNTPAAWNDAMGERLWELSEQLVSVHGGELHR